MSKQLALTVKNSCADYDDDPALDVDINVLHQFASCRLNRHCICARRLHRQTLTRTNSPTSKFASEVATMKYVTQNTNIKVPAVYDWNGTAQNPIKTPYIFMERLPGQHLYKVWDELTIEQKKCVSFSWNGFLDNIYIEFGMS
ncbi:unnamed protein product [Rhizophagus irregularis]|nr:unnamed protein product [Rhizophagus irregularis]